MSHDHDPADAKAAKRLNQRYAQLMGREVMHVRVANQPGQSVTILGTAAQMHGPDGVCTDCHGRSGETVRAVQVEPARDEWDIFVAALRSAVDTAGEIHQGDVRPLIRGRIEPKHIGQFYRRARKEGLIKFLRKEQSNDEQGRNTHHDSPVYELKGTAA